MKRAIFSMNATVSIKARFMVHTAIVIIISITACSLVFDQISRCSQDPTSDDGKSGPPRPVPAAGMAVEQRSPGTRSSAQLTESFDGLGFGFEGPQGKANLR